MQISLASDDAASLADLCKWDQPVSFRLYWRWAIDLTIIGASENLFVRYFNYDRNDEHKAPMFHSIDKFVLNLNKKRVINLLILAAST